MLNFLVLNRLVYVIDVEFLKFEYNQSSANNSFKFNAAILNINQIKMLLATTILTQDLYLFRNYIVWKDKFNRINSVS